MANITGSLAAQEVTASDFAVSWLPLYHDMGLIGFVLAPMCAQRNVDLLSPFDFGAPPAAMAVLILGGAPPSLTVRASATTCRPPRADPVA